MKEKKDYIEGEVKICNNIVELEICSTFNEVDCDSPDSSPMQHDITNNENEPSSPIRDVPHYNLLNKKHSNLPKQKRNNSLTSYEVDCDSPTSIFSKSNCSDAEYGSPSPTHVQFHSNQTEGKQHNPLIGQPQDITLPVRGKTNDNKLLLYTINEPWNEKPILVFDSDPSTPKNNVQIVEENIDSKDQNNILIPQTFIENTFKPRIVLPKKEEDQMRVISMNVASIPESTGKFDLLLQSLQHNQVDIIMLQEHNINYAYQNIYREHKVTVNRT